MTLRTRSNMSLETLLFFWHVGTVGIRIPDQSNFRMVQTCLVDEWLVFKWFGSTDTKMTISLTSVDPNHLKSRQICPVFEWSAQSRGYDHSKSGIRVSGIRMVTVLDNFDIFKYFFPHECIMLGINVKVFCNKATYSA